MSVRTSRRFQVLEIPGAGSSATVCAARDEQGAIVALKVLHRSLLDDADSLSRARDEARMLSRLDHPGVVRVEGFLRVGERPVLLMEWVDGCSLQDLLRASPEGLPIGVVAEVVLQVAQTLDAAYGQPVATTGAPLRIVHRDIKPSHILLSRKGEVKVADFGIAKGDFDDRESTSGAIVHGSRGYTAPERLDGDPDTPAVDVYALGLTLFEAITGRPMVVSRHHERHDPAIERHLAHLMFPALAERHKDRLRDLVRRMCRYEASERPTPAEVAVTLDAWLTGAGLHADLRVYASQIVGPLRDQRRRVPPPMHPAWPEVRFLHGEDTLPPADDYDDEDTQQLSGPMLAGAALDAHVRRALARPDWQRSARDLRHLLQGRSDWSPGPFLAVLDSASPPWWAFWMRRPPADQIVAALLVLRDRPEPEVRHRAARLTRSPSPEVAQAAKTLLESA